MTDNTSLQDQYNSLQQMYATLESDLGTLYNAYPPTMRATLAYSTRMVLYLFGKVLRLSRNQVQRISKTMKLPKAPLPPQPTI